MRKLFRSRVALSIVVATVGVGAIVGLGATLRANERASASLEPLREPSTISLPTTTTVFVPPPLVQPAPAALPPIDDSGIGTGSEGPVVQAYEQRLADIRFDPGPVDGVYDQATTYAVQALQKSLGGAITGRIDPGTAFAIGLYQFTPPLAPDGGPNRTEIDITRQIITLYSDWQVRLIMPTSTGSGERYCYSSPRDNPTVRICEDANTPSGRYEFYEYRDGWDRSPLGQLYNPYYFHGGIAIHGYESVPTTPASHGCARIPMHTAEYFHELVNNGDPVFVFGGRDPVIHSRTPINRSPAPAPPPEPAPPPAPAPPAEPVPPPPA